MLVYTPFAKLLEIAEKTKLKLPIELYKSDRSLAESEGNCIKLRKMFALPKEVAEDTSVRYYTAPYMASLHTK